MDKVQGGSSTSNLLELSYRVNLQEFEMVCNDVIREGLRWFDVPEPPLTLPKPPHNHPVHVASPGTSVKNISLKC